MNTDLTYPLRVWAPINLGALKSNLVCLQRLQESKSPDNKTQIMAVIKADAYGHGVDAVAKYLDNQVDNSVLFFGVAHVAEALHLTNLGIKTRIYLLGATLPEERSAIVDYEWTPCICSLQEAEHFNTLAKAQNKKLKVHIAIDTGMGRGGFLPEQLTAVCLDLLNLKFLIYEGVASHFCASDEDKDFTHVQIKRYEEALLILRAELQSEFLYEHLANTSGILDYSIPQCNLSRPGLGLYGIDVHSNMDSQESNSLIPVMSLKSKITLIRELPKGCSLSYGRDYITPKVMQVATVGIGYGDGYPRSVNKNGEAKVMIDNQLCSILGRVTMDQILVDVSRLSHPQVGDEVELFGSQLSINQVAAWADTIPWEILTQITPRVSRIIID